METLGEATNEEPDGIAAEIGALGHDQDTVTLTLPRRRNEFTVHSLQDALEKSRQPQSRNGSHHGHGSDDESNNSRTDSDEATEIIASCQEDMKALWSDEAVRVVLKKRKIRLEESAGLYVIQILRSSRSPRLPFLYSIIAAGT